MTNSVVYQNDPLRYTERSDVTTARDRARKTWRDRTARGMNIGERISGDLLVAADGARSAIAAQAAGRSLSAPVGLRGFAGTVPMTLVSSAPGDAGTGNRHL